MKRKPVQETFEGRIVAGIDNTTDRKPLKLLSPGSIVLVGNWRINDRVRVTVKLLPKRRKGEKK